METKDKRKTVESWDTKMSSNFSTWEFRCPCCGGGDEVVEEGTVILAQAVRDILGVPVFLNSAYRCGKHNQEVGGEPFSQHLTGAAIDVRRPREVRWMSFVEACTLAVHHVSGRSVDTVRSPIPGGGIGLYRDQDMIHIDCRADGPARWKG